MFEHFYLLTLLHYHFRLAHKEICVAAALPPPKALLSTEAVKAGTDMRRCLETIKENLTNIKKLVVLLGLLVRLLSRDDGHAAGVAQAEFYQHSGVKVLEAVLRQRPADALINSCVATLLPKLEGFFLKFLFRLINFSIFCYCLQCSILIMS